MTVGQKLPASIESSSAINFTKSVANILKAGATLIYAIDGTTARLFWGEGEGAETATDFSLGDGVLAQTVKGRRSLFLTFEVEELLKPLGYAGPKPAGLYVVPLVAPEQTPGMAIFFCGQPLRNHQQTAAHEAETRLINGLLLLIYQAEIDRLKRETSGGAPVITPAKVATSAPVADDSTAIVPLNELEAMMHVGLWRVDLSDNTTYWSPEMYKLLGVDAENEPSMMLYRALMHPDDSKQLEAKLHRAMLFHETFELEHTVAHQDARPVYLKLTGKAVFGPQVNSSKPLQLIGTVQNTTERKRADQENEKLAVVAAKTDNGVVILDGNEKVEWINKSFSRILGYELADIRGTDLFSRLIGPKTSDVEHKRILDGIKNRDSFISEVVYYDKFQNLCSLEVNLTPSLRYDGSLENYIVLINDISERKRAEEQLKELNKQLIDKNSDITDSIQYARRIQFSILPDPDILSEVFINSFIYFQPKDIVSGDFYWFTREGDYFFLAAVDCTGHGVPGAFMSVLGHSQLSEIVKQNKILETEEILGHLHRRIVNALHQSEHGKKVLDGMDVALCRIDLRDNTMSFAGANRPITIFKAGETESIELKPDKLPIGSAAGAEANKERKFTAQTFALSSGDTLYLFSDGVTDQFGGKDGKKMTKNRFLKQLATLKEKDLPDQKEEIVRFISEWQGGYTQTDDVLVIGVRID